MDHVGSIPLDSAFEQDAAVIVYISNLSCNTCVSREVKYLNALHGRFRDRLDFVMIVNGRDDYYANNLRRIGRVMYPILIEPEAGWLGFPSRFSISFLD